MGHSLWLHFWADEHPSTYFDVSQVGFDPQPFETTATGPGSGAADLPARGAGHLCRGRDRSHRGLYAAEPNWGGSGRERE